MASSIKPKPVHLQDKTAVIDLGTNTFHIVVFEKKENVVSEIFRKRHYVFLSEGGIDIISNSAILRAHQAILDFKSNLKRLEITDINIIGTEALRRASNGPKLSKYIETQLGNRVELISGLREAELISKGVRWQFNNVIQNAMIMDIGGGSVELIHLLNNEIKWMQSFPLGIGVLHNNFNHQEPILSKEIEDIEIYVADIAQELLSYLENNRINTLIGASGSFELIPAILEGIYPPKIERIQISLDEFQLIHDRIIRSDLKARKEINGLPPVKAQMIIVSFILMNWIIKTLDAKELLISKYAVKEGLVAEKMKLLTN